MSNVGHGGGGAWGRGRPWGGAVWGGGWGGAPVEVLVPPIAPMLLDPAMMAAAGYAEIVGGQEIVGWIPAPPRPAPPRPAPPIEHFGHEHDHWGHEGHDHPHRWGMAGHEMAGSPMHGYTAGFLPDFEMGGSPMQGYAAGFLPDFEMGCAPHTAGFLPDFEMGYTPMPGDQMLVLNDRRGLPAQGGYELGHVGHGTGEDPFRRVDHEIHRDLGQPFHRRAWEDHAARRGWDRGHDVHRHDDPPQQGGAPPAPPGDWHGHRDFHGDERRDVRRDERRRW